MIKLANRLSQDTVHDERGVIWSINTLFSYGKLPNTINNDITTVITIVIMLTKNGYFTINNNIVVS